MRTALLLMLCASMMADFGLGQRGWAPKDSPLLDVQLALGRGQLTLAKLLLNELPPASGTRDEDDRALLRTATLLGTARADALLNLAKARAASEVGYRALAALYQHLTLDRSIGGSQGRMQPVFPLYGFLRDDIEFDAQVSESEIAQFAKEAIPLSRRAEMHRPKAALIEDPSAAGVGPPLAELFENLLLSQLPMASIRPTKRLPVPRPLARSVFARFKSADAVSVIAQHELLPDTEWLPIPELPTGRILLELEADGVRTRRWMDQNPFDAVAQIFDNTVVFAVTRNGHPFEGASIRFDNRTVVTDATGIAVMTPRMARDYMTSASVTAAEHTLLIPISVRSTPSSAETSLLGHVMVDKVNVRPGERIQGRLLLLRDPPTQSTPTPLQSTGIEWTLIYGDDKQRIPLTPTTTSLHGIVPIDVTVPSDATAAPVSVEVRVGRRLVESFRLAQVQVHPEIALRRKEGPHPGVIGVANSDGTVTFDVNADGLSEKVVIPVKRSQMFLLDIVRIPFGCEEVLISATLSTESKTEAQDRLVLTAPFSDQPASRPTETPSGTTIEAPVIRPTTLNSLLNTVAQPRERHVEGVVRFLPRAPVLVSIVRDTNVLSTVVSTDDQGRAPFAFKVGPEFGSSVECVASGGSPANSASQVMPLPVTTHRIALTKSVGKDGRCILSPKLFSVEGTEVLGTFSAVVHSGLDGSPIESIANALPPRQASVRTFGTDRIVPDITVLGDMFRDGDLWRATLNNRVYGYDLTTQVPARSPYKSLPIRGHSVPIIWRTSAFHHPLAVVPAWSATASEAFLELPESSSWTAYICGVDASGAYAEITITNGDEPVPASATVDFESIRLGVLAQAMAKLSATDEGEFTKSLPRFPPFIQESEIPAIRELLVAKLTHEVTTDAWTPPEGAALRGLTPVLLDDRVLAELDRVGVVRRLVGFPDPNHAATTAWSKAAETSTHPTSRDLRLRTLITRLARGDESVLASLTQAIADREHEFPKSALNELDRTLIPNLWRGAITDATRLEGIRTQRSPTDARCEAWLGLFEAVYGRVKDRHSGWRGIACAFLDVEGAMPGATQGALTTRFATLSARLAAAVLEDVKSLSLDVPADADQLKRLPFRTLIESLPAKERVPHAVSVISGWLRATPRPSKWVDAAIGDLLESLPRYGRLHDVTSRRLSLDPAWPDQVVKDYVALLSASPSEEVASELAHHASPRVWKECSLEVLSRSDYVTTFSACVELWRREDGIDVLRRIARDDLWASLLLPARFHALGCKDPSEVFEGLDLDFIIGCARSDLGQPEHQAFNMVVRALMEAGRDDPAPLMTALLDRKVKAGRIAFAAALGSLRYTDIPWPTDSPDWDEARAVLMLRADPTTIDAYRTWYATKSRPTAWLLGELGPSLTMQDWLATIERLRVLDKRSPPVGFQGVSLLLGCRPEEVDEAFAQVPDSWCQLTADLVSQAARTALIAKSSEAKGQRRIEEEYGIRYGRWSTTRQAAAVARCLDLIDRGHPIPSSDWAEAGIELWLFRTGLGVP